jgi:hypothetical protein
MRYGWKINKSVGKVRGSETRQLVAAVKDNIKAGYTDRKIAKELLAAGVTMREMATALRLELRNSR